MTTRKALLLALATATVAAPAQAQNPMGSPGPHMGNGTYDDLRSMMNTMMADPVFSKRMIELMDKNPQFKTHVTRMRSMMAGSGPMMGGGSMMGSGCPAGPAAPATAPKP